MKINTPGWNRLRYSFYEPFYDLAGRPLQPQRARAISLLHLNAGNRVLIVGAGTGLDLELLPTGLGVVAVDISPAMVRRIERRANDLGRAIEASVMDAGALSFPDRSFDAVLLHLILAVMPDPIAGIREVARVLKPGGLVSIFDKFVSDKTRPSVLRRLLNPWTSVAFSSITRQLGPILEEGGLRILSEESAVRGWMKIVIAQKPPDPFA